jgi:DNA-binding PadR family transcriptional regulator
MRHYHHEHGHHEHGHHGRGHHGRDQRRNRGGSLGARLLAMIAAKPAQGHDLLQALEGRGMGPDAIYPTLALLEDQGLIEATVEAGKKRYQVTEAGRSALRQRADTSEPIAQAVTQFGAALGRRLSCGQLSDKAAAAIAAAIDTASIAIATQ